MDDLNGFRIEVRERDGAGASATYTYPMPVGQSWRFHHWIHNSMAYLDNYVERTDSVLSTVFIGNHFEQDLIAGNGVRKYYYLGGKRVANGDGMGLYFIHGDQLGSTRLVTRITGTVTPQMLCKPYGLVRCGPARWRRTIGSRAIARKVTRRCLITARFFGGWM